jgi:hypothetical protein
VGNEDQENRATTEERGKEKILLRVLLSSVVERASAAENQPTTQKSKLL